MSKLPGIETTISALLATNARIELSKDQHEMDLHLDSLATLEVIIGLEKQYGLEVDESDINLLENFKSVRSIAQFVEANTAAHQD